MGADTCRDTPGATSKITYEGVVCRPPESSTGLLCSFYSLTLLYDSRLLWVPTEPARSPPIRLGRREEEREKETEVSKQQQRW